MDYDDSVGDDNFSESEGETIHTDSDGTDGEDNMDVDGGGGNRNGRPRRDRRPAAAKRAGGGGGGGRRIVRAPRRIRPGGDGDAADLDPMRDSDDNESLGSDDSDDDEGGDGNINAPLPPAPPPRQFYDAHLEEIFARSAFARQVRIDRVFGGLRAQEPIRETIAPDPLGGARIDDKHFAKILEDPDAFQQADPVRTWSFLCDQLGQLCTIKEIPAGDPFAQVDFLADLALVVDCANLYPHPPPPGKKEEELVDQLARLGSVCWDFYHKIRPTYHKRKVYWWLAILNLHKMAIEKLPSIHLRLTHVYNNYTVGQFMREAERTDADAKRGQTAPETQSMHWLYMRHAHANGFVGCAVPTVRLASGMQSSSSSSSYHAGQEASAASAPDDDVVPATDLCAFHHSTITHSKPDQRIVPGVVSSRGVSVKVGLHTLFRPSDRVMGIKFSQLSLLSFLKLMEEVHKRWNTLLWTPTAEFFTLLLFYHFSRLATDGISNVKLLDYHLFLKRKPVVVSLHPNPGTFIFKPVSKRFIRDMETIFINHLVTIQTYYRLVERTLAVTPHAPVEAIMAADQFRLQLKEHDGHLPDDYKWHHTSQPIGYYNTACFPECQQFLPSIDFLHQTDMVLMKTFLKTEAVVEGVGTDAAVRYYYDRLIRAILPAGAFDATLASKPALVPKAAHVLDEFHRASVTPVSTLTFKVLAAAVVLGFVRGNNLYSDLAVEPAHAPLAAQAYACMIISMLHVSHFHFALNAGNDIGMQIINSGGTSGDSQNAGQQLLMAMSGAGFGALADEYLLKNPRLSATGDDRLSHRFADFAREKSRQQRLLEESKPGTQQSPLTRRQQPQPHHHHHRHHQPRSQQLIEKIESARDWMILCDDTHRELIIREDKHIKWTPGRDNWPRVLSIRGEFWVFVEDANFFLCTIDFMEALYAWYTCVIQLFGKRLKLTGGYLALFERLLGRVFREVLCTTGVG